MFRTRRFNDLLLVFSPQILKSAQGSISDPSSMKTAVYGLFSRSF
ncbi:hypothetical protein NBRC3257_1754 [Gluconobacter thailandicus NBRC 3257]|uniref:Uncharacterized protein n=1 Tax=Gluconobacter thailandicus NBRC 3257 TaxID=1381097 RepID=A0ABQ0IX26_GLUTH|nr:hypothetical protein NBRC3255_2387 [Gluconobacter thailandicus NBRC 3255]GAD26755.1 hypothetical protein NBRC3257_1754 [Gluconobacter thailandicus NBRC 3257]